MLAANFANKAADDTDYTDEKVSAISVSSAALFAKFAAKNVVEKTTNCNLVTQKAQKGWSLLRLLCLFVANFFLCSLL